MTDLKLLRERIEDSGITMTALAKKAGITRVTLYNRFNGKGDFTASEMVAIADMLHLTNKERDNIFFAKR